MRTRGVEFLKERLREKSTVLVLVSLVAGFLGLDLAPDYENLICLAVVFLVSGIGITTREEKE